MAAGAASAPSVVIATPPPAPAVGIRQTIYGKVTDVDRDGEVKIETNNDSLKVKVSREVASRSGRATRSRPRAPVTGRSRPSRRRRRPPGSGA